MVPRELCPLLVLLAIGSGACVETAAYEKVESQLAEAKIASARKDEELRAYGWQMSALAQQLRDAQAKNEALQRDLYGQIQQLSAANAGLSERLKKVEGERAALAVAASAESLPSSSRDGKPSRDGLRPEELRRMIAVDDARNAQIIETLARIERLLGAPPKPSPEPKPRPSPSPVDVVDPWGFGSRK